MPFVRKILRDKSPRTKVSNETQLATYLPGMPIRNRGVHSLLGGWEAAAKDMFRIVISSAPESRIKVQA